MSNTLSLQLITEAVVAEYIHEISERHRDPQPAPDPAQDTGSGGAPAVDCRGGMFV